MATKRNRPKSKKAKPASAEKSRYVTVTNLQRRTAVEGIHGVTGTKPHERAQFYRAVQAIKFSDEEQEALDQRDRAIVVMDRKIDAATGPELEGMLDEIEELRASAKEWDEIEEVLELSVASIESLIKFIGLSPLNGRGIMRVQPFVEELEAAEKAEEGSDYFEADKPNGKAAATA